MPIITCHGGREPAVPTHWRLKQENHKPEARLGYVRSKTLSQKTNKNKTKISITEGKTLLEVKNC
jgi:hypothetical protein